MNTELGLDTQEREDIVHLCTVRCGEEIYAVKTCAIREVLGNAQPQRVPLAPVYISGVLIYRGEVLEAVSLRTLLGVDANGERRALIVEGCDGERFALMVDSVGGMASATESAHEENPATMEVRCSTIFNGVYRTETGLMPLLDVDRIKPAELAKSGIFHTRTETE